MGTQQARASHVLCAASQNVNYPDELMKKIELNSHFIGGMLLVTNLTPGALEAQLTRMLADLDPNLTINSIRTMQQQIELSFDQQRAVARSRGAVRIVALSLRDWPLRSNRLFGCSENQRNRHSHGAWCRPPEGA